MRRKIECTAIFDDPEAEYYEFYVRGELPAIGSCDCTHLILSAGSFDHIYVRAGGRMKMSGGYVADLGVEDNGKLIITGGTACITEAGGEVVVEGGEVTFNPFTFSGHTTSKATAHAGTSMHNVTAKTAIVSSGGEIAESVLNEGDYCEVEFGGRATDITVNRGAKLILKSGSWGFSITVNPGGLLSVADAKEVEMVTVASGGTISVVHGCPERFMLDQNAIAISPKQGR